MALSGARKFAIFVASSAAVLLLLLVVATLSQKRAAELRTRDWIVRLLEHKFNSNVELADFHVQVFPRMTVSGAGLLLHYWAAPDAPPLIRIEHFSFDLGLLGVFRAPHRIQSVRLKRMVIAIPPRGLRNKAVQPLDSKWNISDVVVGTMESENMELLTLSDKPGVEPLDWEIHNVVLHEVGAAKPFAFQGTLTNAKPKGEIATAGDFGPWDSEDPGATPVSGTYGFADADLGPFPGIAGILSSSGNFSGELERLEVRGETDTPDFSLDNVGKPVPLHTNYSATVDGTNGDTQLHPVHAILGQSEIVASGSVVNIPAKKGHQITLDVTTAKARIEDILQLAIKSDQPFLRGPVRIVAKLSLPPGKDKVIDKMDLNGTFNIVDGKWTRAGMREKLESLSRHAEGKPQDEDAGSAVTGLTGKFVLKNGLITFSSLTFSVPGADVQLAGTYEIHSRKIDMQGRLRMQAKLSQTVTGAKSFFLKAIDPFFAKGRAGTDLPITITGTEESPVFGVTVFHKKIEKQLGNAGMK
jgi:AsmA-like C-terminal region